MKGFKVKGGFFSRLGFFSFQGFNSGQGFNFTVDPTPPIFNGIYAFYPFATNGNNTVTAGAKINERLGDKIFNNDSGNLVTVGEYETAYTGSGELDEPSATTQIVTDMSAWDDLFGSDVVYDDTTKQNVWTFTGPSPSRAFTNSALTQGLDYTLSLDVKKGESQFLQITGSSGFDLFVVNYDLLNGIYNVQVNEATLKDSGLVDLGDYFRVYLTAESINSSPTGRLVLCKATSLTSERLPDSPIDGQFTVKYPNFVQASYASSPIDAPLAPATRDSDKAAVPTSDVYIDNNHELTESGGIASLAGTKYDGLLNNKIVGAYFVDANQIKAEITAYSSNELTVNGSIENTVLAIHYSTLTLAETTQLRADVGDTPPTEFPDGSFRWLDWPAENVAFEIDFTMLSDDPNELCHVEWVNAPKDTYAARIADNLEFNHGDDELVIPYTPPITKGETLKGYAVITPTELIGYVDGLEVSRVTRTDTQLAEWDSKCYLGGFNDTLAPVKLANLKVFDYVAPPPVGSQLIVEDFSAQGGAGASLFDTGQLTGTATGSLSPPISLGSLGNIYAVASSSNTLPNKVVALQFDNTVTGQTINAYFNGQLYIFTFNPSIGYAVESDALYDF